MNGGPQSGRPRQLVASSDAVSAADPYAEPLDRAPLVDEVDIVVGGFTGPIAGAELRKAGVPQVRVIEKAGGFGGVW
ncbi:hypothetical protein ACSYGO_07480 [Streptomyces krungchingensis]